MNAAVLEAIYFSPTKGELPQAVGQIEVMPLGLAGDRYAMGVGTFNKPVEEGDAGRHVTLIESEVIDACLEVSGADYRNGVHRRNLVTRGLTAAAGGVPLAEIIYRRLRIGRDVVLRVDRTCPPCGRLSRLTGTDSKAVLKLQAGLRLTVLESGIIRAGDSIEILSRR